MEGAKPMSVFTGAQQRGAMRVHRARKRVEAEVRNEQTPDSRRRANRPTIELEHPEPTQARPRRRRATRRQGAT